MADISQIKLPNNTTYDLKDSKKTGIYYVKGTQTAATGAWTGNIDVPALYTGLTIMYYLPWAPSGNATLNLTLSDGTTTGAVNCYYHTGRLTTHYTKGSNIVMTYYKAGDISIDGTATTDNRWIANANYADGNNTYYLSNYYNYFVAGPNKIFPYTIVMQNADGRWESIVTSSSTGTSKARNAHGFRLGQLAYLNAKATYAENAKVGDNQISYHKTDLIDHRYSFNTANNSTSGTTTKKPVYLVGAINASDGLFYLDATWWTQTLPTTADGKLYIYLGDAIDYYRMSFVMEHPVYWYRNGMIREFAQDAATVNGLTVEKAVPSNAVFTDTTYTGTGAISVNASTHVISTTAEANQNAFSNVKVGSTTVAADTKTDTLELVGSNVTLTPDATNDKVTIGITKSNVTTALGYTPPTADTNVTQTADDSTNSNFEVLMGATADNTTRTEAAKKSSKLKFNPSTGNLQATQLNGVTIGSSPKFTDHTYSGTGLISVNSSGVISTTATANTGTITSVKTTAGAHTAINVTSGAANFNVPTKTSHLTNDSGFITSDTKVTQTADDSTASAFEVLFSNTADNTTRTEAARKSSKLKFQPSSGNLSVTSINNISFAFITGAVGQTGDTSIGISGTGFLSVNSIIPLALPADGKSVGISEYTVTDTKITFIFSSPLTSVTNIKALLIYIH